MRLIGKVCPVKSGGDKLVIGWKVATLSPDIASVRYRAVLPLLALESDGYHCRISSEGRPENLAGLNVLVIVKSFTAEDYFLAQEAAANGTPVVLDLCDNIFVESYGDKPGQTKHCADMFVEIAHRAQAVIVTTEPLAKIVQAHIGQYVPVHVIADGIETPELLSQGLRKLAEAAALERKNGAVWLKQQIRTTKRRLSLLSSVKLIHLIRRLPKYCATK